MLAGGGVLPGGVLGAAQVEPGQLRDRGVDHAAHVDPGDGHRQQADGGEHAEAAAHVVGHHEALPAVGDGEGLEHAAGGVGSGEDMLVGMRAVFPVQQFAENAEGGGGLQGGAGFGDNVHVKLHVAELGDGVAQGVGGEAVAHEKDLRVALPGVGVQQLDGAAGAEVGAADADDDQRLGTAADLLGGGYDAVELLFLDALRQAAPAGEVGAEAGAAGERLMGEARVGKIGTRGGKERLRAGKIDFNHKLLLISEEIQSQVLYHIFAILQGRRIKMRRSGENLLESSKYGLEHPPRRCIIHTEDAGRIGSERMKQ